MLTGSTLYFPRLLHGCLSQTKELSSRPHELQDKCQVTMEMWQFSRVAHKYCPLLWDISRWYIYTVSSSSTLCQDLKSKKSLQTNENRKGNAFEIKHQGSIQQIYKDKLASPQTQAYFHRMWVGRTFGPFRPLTSALPTFNKSKARANAAFRSTFVYINSTFI